MALLPRIMNVTRRLATDNDTPFARQAHHGAYREAVTRQFGRWDEADQDVFFARDWAGAEFEILQVGGVPCGFACIEERDEDVHVREIVVIPTSTAAASAPRSCARRRTAPARRACRSSSAPS